MAPTVGREEIQAGIRELGLSGRPVCVHSSLRSFGIVTGGAETVVQAFVEEGCTLLVPTFAASIFAIAPPEGMRPDRNGLDYETALASPGAEHVFTTSSNDVSLSMGTIPAAVLALPGRVRGDNPLCSFTAIGPDAASLVGSQRALDVYAPLRLLGARDGAVLLIGVGLECLTLIHLAEEKAGRTLFRRWANAPDGRPLEVEIGGCSDGFGRFEPILRALGRETLVGESRWRAFPVRAALDAAEAAIRADPGITHCGSADCRCNDAVAGGPLAVS